MSAVELHQAGLDAAIFTFIRECVATQGRIDLLQKVEAGGIEEARKWAAKNPDTVREISKAIAAYAAVVNGEKS